MSDLTLDIQTDKCIFDVDGQSWSMDLGSGGVVEKFLESDPPRPEELSAALSVVELHLDDLMRSALLSSVSDSSLLVLKGLGGHLAAVEVGDGRTATDTDGYVFSSAAAEEVFRWFATEESTSRSHNPGLAEGMVEEILGVMVIVVEACRQLDIETLRVELGKVN